MVFFGQSQGKGGSKGGYNSTQPLQAKDGGKGPGIPVKNVLFFAKTQEGKSTTSDELYELVCDQKPSTDKASGMVLGKGTESATSSVTCLDARPVPMLQISDYPPEDSENFKKVKAVNEAIQKARTASNGEMNDDIAEKLIELRLDIQLEDKDFKFKDCIVKSHDNISWKFRAIDTPGMNDSHGRDDESIEDIIYTLQGQQSEAGPSPEIAACAFVVKSTSAFDSGWKASVKRYWDQFEDLRPLWMFIHTAVDPYHEYEDGTCYEKLCEMRQEAVTDAVVASVSVGAKDKELIKTFPHFFIDNKVGRASSVKYQFKSWEHARSFQKFLCLVEKQRSVSVSNLLYTKTSNQTLIDSAVLNQIDATVSGVKKAMDSFKIEGGDQLNEIQKANTEITRQRQIINDAQSELLNKETSAREQCEQCTESQDWTFWGGSRSGERQFAKPYDTCRIDVDKLGGYDHGTYNISGSGPWVVKMSSPWCRGYSFKITVDVEQRDKYSSSIQQAKKDIEVAEEQIGAQKEKIALLQVVLDQNEKNKAELQNLQAKIDFISQWKTYVSKERVKLDPEEWKILKEFYIRYLDKSKDGMDTNSLRSVLEVLAPLVMTATEKIPHEKAKADVKANLIKYDV